MCDTYTLGSIVLECIGGLCAGEERTGEEREGVTITGLRERALDVDLLERSTGIGELHTGQHTHMRKMTDSTCHANVQTEHPPRIVIRLASRRLPVVLYLLA